MKHRHGKQRAAIDTAHKLLRVLYTVIKTGKNYEKNKSFIQPLITE
jgi:inhibitor of KinA sporulation pathway (predicted exonuclease)